MNQFIKIIGAVLTATVLTACGGGGGDSGSPAPAAGNTITPTISPSTTRYTQDDIKSVARKGLTATTLLLTDSSAGPGSLASFFMIQTNQAGGSTGATTESCALFGKGSGSVTCTITKSAVRNGFAAGDRMAVTFNNCDFAGSGTFSNGAVTFTATTTLVDLPLFSYDYSVDVKFTGYSAKYGTTTTAFDGFITLGTKFQQLGLVTSQKVTVPNGQSLRVAVAGAAGNQTLEFASGAVLSYAGSVTPNTASAKLDGDVKWTSGGAATSLSISTPISPSGTTVVGPKFAPTSGTVNIKDTTRNIATSTTISGNNASVSGDTDGNGSLDLVFNSAWAALLQ